MSDSDSIDVGRSSLLSLQLPTLHLSPDAPQLHEIEWHPTKPILAAADVEGAVAFYQLRRPAPRAAIKRRAKSSGLGETLPPLKSELEFGGHVQAARLTYHTGAVRSIAFHPNGEYAYSASADQSIGIIDLSTLTLSSQLHSAHETGINRIAFYDENLLLSGDDDGFVHVWDLRANNMVAEAKAAAAGRNGATTAARPSKAGPFGSHLYPLLRFEDAGDYVSDFLPLPSLNRLVVTSGDGHLYVYDMRVGHIHEQVHRAVGLKSAKKMKPQGKSKTEKKLTPSGHMSHNGHAVDTWFAMSDDVSDELSGAVLLKRGRKLVVAGREEGVLNTYKWDYFGVPEDHFHLNADQNDLEGAGSSIDCMLKVDEDTLLTGSTDGLIRLVALHPNRLLGIMGTHDDFPIECMRMSPDKKDYFDTALKPIKQADADEDDEDEDEEDVDDNEQGEFISKSKDVDEDASAEEGFSFSSICSSLTPRFLASSSHDSQVKFWNCTELFEVDPDEPAQKDSSDEEGEGEGDNSDVDSDDSDADEEAAAEVEAEKSMSKQNKKKMAAAASASASAKKSIVGDKRKKPSSKDDPDAEDGESDSAVDVSDDVSDDDAAEKDALMDTSDCGNGSDVDGDTSDSDEEAAADRLIKAAAMKVKAASSANIFARLAPATGSPKLHATASAAAASSTSSSKPSLAPSTSTVPNMWLLVAPATAPDTSTTSTGAPAPSPSAGLKKRGVSSAAVIDIDNASDSSEPRMPSKGARQVGKDLNADTGFFSNLPITHPMHPSQQHKRKGKAPLQIVKDNIAHREGKKRAALQEKLAKRRAKTNRLEQRRADAIAKGDDPDAQQLSTDDEDTRNGGNKRRKGQAGRPISDSDASDDTSDSDDEGKQPKERKMNAKERRAAKKAEKKRNPFFDGME
jgi:WD40 repeat protein